MNDTCKIDTGDWVGQPGGPHWTPYAQAIADSYAVQVPFYLTVPTTLTGVALQRRLVRTEPFQHDVLLLAANLNFATDGTADSGQSVFLQVADQRSGLFWAAPTVVSSAVVTAYGGVNANARPVYPLPEAFFLPKGVELQHEWLQPTGGNATGGMITWIGVQLMNPVGGSTPEKVILPNGDIIRVGSRMPWLCTLGFGRRVFSAGILSLQVNNGSTYVQYTPAVDCNIEIHDIGCNFFSVLGVSQEPDSVLVTINEAGRQGMWTPELSPITGVFGDFTQIYPSLPFNKPYLLDANHRLRITMQNNRLTNAISNPFVTLRGVRLCKM